MVSDAAQQNEPSLDLETNTMPKSNYFNSIDSQGASPAAKNALSTEETT